MGKEKKLGKHRFRIRPGVKVEKRNIWGNEYRARAWYDTDDDALAERLKDEKLHPNSDDPALCFEVLTPEAARRVHKEEQKRVEPQGPDQPQRPSRRRRRRAAMAAAE